MNACEVSDDLPRKFLAAVRSPRLNAATAWLKHYGEQRQDRRLTRLRLRRRRQVLREIEGLPWDVQKDIGHNRDF